MILGLDISTSVIGITYLNKDKSIYKITHISYKSNDEQTLFEKSCLFREIIKSIKPEHIFIEEPVSLFKMGASTANTISLLLRFNAICSYIIYDLFGIEPIYINVNSARKICGILIKRGATEKEKKQAFEYMLSKEPLQSYPFDKHQKGAYKNNYRSYVYDEVDSYIIALAGAMKYL